MQGQTYFTNIITWQNLELSKEILYKKVKQNVREQSETAVISLYAVVLPLISFRNYAYIINFRTNFLFYILTALENLTWFTIVLSIDNPNLRHHYSRRKYREDNLRKKGNWGQCLVFLDRNPDTYKASHDICLANIVHYLSLTIHELSCNKRKCVLK